MFDVVWTDPQRESVGQRRARKELEKNKGKSTTPISSEHSVRTSVCTRSTGTTSSSSDHHRPREKSGKSERTFGGFFSSRTLRRVTSTAGKNHPSSPALHPPSSSEESRRRSSLFGIESISSSSESQKHPSSKPGSIASSRNSLQAPGRYSDTDIKTIRSESRAHSRLSIGHDHDSISNVSDGAPGPSTLQNTRMRPKQQQIIQVVPVPEQTLTDSNLNDFLAMEDLTSPISRGTSHFAGSVYSSQQLTNRDTADSVFSKWTAPSSVYTQSTICDHTSDRVIQNSSCINSNNNNSNNNNSNNNNNSSSSSKHPSYVQQLGPASFITMSTQVTVAPRHSNDLEVTTSRTTISSQPPSSSRVKPPPTPPETPQNERIPHISRKPDVDHHHDLVNAQCYDDGPTVSDLSFTSTLEDHPIDFRSESRRGPSTTPTGWIQAFGPNKVSQWKTPHEWNEEYGNVTICETTRVNVEDLLADEDTLPHQPAPAEPTLVERFGTIQEYAKAMKTAGARAAIAALNCDYGLEKDANVYKELEMEKKRWMLTALYAINEEEVEKYSATGLTMSKSRAQRVLCLFESPGMTSYISATHPSKHIYHVAGRGSQLGEVYQNIISVQTPAISPLHIPVVEQAFGAVYAYSLPSALASSEIPSALGRIYNCLAPGGILHLALIDPMPSSKRIGPRLREWIDNNLMKSLSHQYRCTNPSKMFRQWLMDAGLRGHGSVITTAKFPAVFPTERKRLHQNKLSSALASQGLELKASTAVDIPELTDTQAQTELRCLVGRLLWKQIWGRYVGAHKWWWEYPEIVQECIRYETYWQYHLIEAVRG